MNNESDELLKEITNYLNIINVLSEEQIQFKKFSKEWIDIEQRIIECECNLVNLFVLFQIQRNIDRNNDATEKQLAKELLTLLPVIGLHLYKYFDNMHFKEIIETYLSKSSRVLIDNIIKKLKQ